MAGKAGALIREARTGAGLTQEQLARKISGLSTSEVGRAERGEIRLTQATLKEIALVTGVTQASLLNAAREDAADADRAARTSAAKRSTAKAGAAASKSSASTAKLTAAEAKLLEAYRAAGSDERKAALRVLRGECGGMLTALLGGTGSAADTVADLIGDALGRVLGGQ